MNSALDLHWYMSEKLLWIICVAVVLGSILLIPGCTEKQVSKLELAAQSDEFKDWQWYQQDNFIVFYSPQHPQVVKMPDVANHYIQCLQTVTTSFDMPPITDTILFIYYAGPMTGRNATGHEYPFANDTAIHFWIPSFPGPVLMQYLLPRWSSAESRHKFLYHGLITLFDFSGQKYHESTIGYLNKGKFMKLSDLVADTAINSNTERYQSAEAASFCAYLLGQKGADKTKALYESETAFDSTVQSMFGITTDSLEREWLDYVRQVVPADSIVDSLWN